MKKLTKLEKYWILYDVGNSAFVMLISTIIPIYYKNMAQTAGVSDSDSTAFFGYAASFATLIVALLGPVLGTISDTKGWKKAMFTVFLILGAAGCGALALPGNWLVFLVVLVMAKVGLSASMVFYDSMLVDVSAHDRMDEVSSHGYAWGYLGSCIPFILSLILVLMGEDLLGLSMIASMQIVFVLNALWWVAMACPLLRNYKQKYACHEDAERKNLPVGQAVKESLVRLSRIAGEMRQHKKVFLFLIAFFFYIDGVYTIIEMATSYGKDVGIGDSSMLLALLLTQLVAFPFAILFGSLTKRIEPEKLISLCILAYFGIAVFAFFLQWAWQFWLLATCVGIFQGAIQALSRAYFAKIIPREKASEYFGIFDIFGKGASFMGTLVMGISTQIFDTSKAGVIVIAGMFIVGLVIFIKQSRYT